MAKVAVVGLGAMGSRIAGRLLESGHELLVWNRDPTKAESFAEDGAHVASTPAAAATGAEAVITIVSDPAALAAVTEGPDGVVAGASGTTILQMSTVGLAATARLASVLPPDADLLDAPVLGSLTEAEGGTLTIYAGGADAVLERWMPLFSELGTVLHVGPVGAGSAAKLIANSVLVGVIGVLGEALALSESVGLQRERAFDVLGTTALAQQAERRRKAVESRDYPPRFTLSLARKDADLILDADPRLRLIAAIRAWLAEAENAGDGEKDYSAVLARIIERE